jgi:diguanylate cyclase (GGDEF)-like protein
VAAFHPFIEHRDSPRVLLIAADDGLAAGLRQRGVDVAEQPDIPAATQWLQEQSADILFASLPANGIQAATFLHALHEQVPSTKKVLMTGNVNLGSLVTSLNHAHVDFFLVRPFTLEEAQQAIQHLWSTRQLEQERDELHQQNSNMLEELRSFNAVLERRVRERTDELAQANAQLAGAVREIERKNRALVLLNESLNIQATVDPLTGLFNRREFRNRLHAEWGRFKRHQSPMSVVLLDIDHFKRVNDTHGHDGGDAVLEALGALLRAQQRRQDVLCRYGGEEFVILLPDTRRDAAHLAAESLRKRVMAHSFRVKEARLHVTVSLGVAGAIENNPANEDEFIALADQALYRAKAEGRNRTAVCEIHQQDAPAGKESQPAPN